MQTERNYPRKMQHCWENKIKHQSEWAWKWSYWEGNTQEGQGSSHGGYRLQVSTFVFLKIYLLLKWILSSVICCKNCHKRWPNKDSLQYEFEGVGILRKYCFLKHVSKFSIVYSFWHTWITSLCPWCEYFMEKMTQYSLPVQVCCPYISSDVPQFWSLS